ncbi:P-loop containing nucleoside triphosphate hydrolase protein [Schizophyllum commune]
MRGLPLDDLSTSDTSALRDVEHGTTYDDREADDHLRTIQLGVWTVTLADGDVKQHTDTIFSYLPVVQRMFVEVYHVDPWAVKILLLSKFFSAIQPTLLLYFFSRLLEEIEKIAAIIMRLGCVAFVALFDWWFSGTFPRLKSRTQRHFKAALLEAQLRTNVPTSLRPSSAGNVSSRALAQHFMDLFDLLDSAMSAASLITFVIASASASVGGANIMHTTNEPFLRTERLAKLAEPQLREEVISANIGDYIMREFRAASAALRNVSDEHPFLQYQRRPTPAHDVFTSLAGDLPIVYCVLSAAFSSGSTSVSSVAILQQSAQTFLQAVTMTLFYFNRFREYANEFEQYYKVIEAPVRENVLVDGYLSYPLVTSSDMGMEFELRDVQFAYPGDPDKLALRAVKAPSLLTRIYDPTSGAILLDGEPLSSYRQHTLYQATDVLSQGHHLFPLSMGENIGLGCVERMHDERAVRAAAEAGGASACIAKLRDGLDTVLDPDTRASGNNLLGKEGEALRKRLDALDKPVEVSGGETQRIVAARTFMRFNSGKVRAVLVDEPSSALDPEGELALFDNLRAEREGKTMIFVTHRFGHLTKYADQIICMKDGEVVERGVHDELIAMDGEYKKLYDIQASAFVAST